MCLFRRKQIADHAREPQDELVSALEANGFGPDVAELIINKYGINNKRFEIREDSSFGVVEIFSNDSISYCDHPVDSHLCISFRFLSKTLVKIHYLFIFTLQNSRVCSEDDCYKASAAFQSSNPSFSFRPAADRKIELIINAESPEIYLDSPGTCEYNLTNLMWHLDDEKAQVKLAFDSLLSR